MPVAVTKVTRCEIVIVTIRQLGIARIFFTGRCLYQIALFPLLISGPNVPAPHNDAVLSHCHYCISLI